MMDANEDDETQVCKQGSGTVNEQYGQSKRASELTSESNKLELNNLPPRPSYQVIKNLLERRFKLNPRKIRIGTSKVFVTFKDETERNEAMAALDGQEWKGKSISAQASTPRDDILAKKRKIGSDHQDQTENDQSETVTDEQINNQVCPLWSVNYTEQLKYKERLVRSVLNFSKQIQKLCPTLRTDAPKLYEWVKKNGNICCQFEGIVPSPVITGYRNKCEFNISRDCDIGFKIGRYKNGSERVCRPPDNCPIVTKNMFVIIDLFKEYLKNSTGLKGFDLVTHEGHYRQITIRCNSSDEYLIIVDLHPQDLSKNDLEKEVENIVELFKPMKEILSIYVNISAKCPFSSSNQNLQLVSGESCLYEKLAVDPDHPLRFRIGPGSFFQVNSRTAELLYRSIIEEADLDSTSMVLDVGCGTGTIGLSLARKVNHVIGIEIVPAAIEDAKSNAKANGIDNVTFYTGKAEDLIGESITILKNKLAYQGITGEIVAIVDPPRVGFNNSFIKTLRASNIKKIVYIACDPKANTNLVTLCRPTSKSYQGDPFVPTRAKAFDLFPHTKCCELMIVYERLSLVVGN